MNNTDPDIPHDAIYCVSGLIYQTLKEGKGGQRPGPEDIVQVRITNITGENDAKKTEVQSLAVNEVNAGLSEAFQIMTLGQKLKVWIPAFLRQDLPSKDIDKFEIYEIELEGFIRMKEHPVIPDHLISPRNKDQ